MNIETDSERMFHVKFLESMKCEISMAEMVTVYLSYKEGLSKQGVYCALVPNACVEKSLELPTWDMEQTGGYPETIFKWKDGENIPKYFRFGNDIGIEPFVIIRDFYGIHPSYVEISEEFRLFHGLYHDKKQDYYFKIDEDGIEHCIATVEPTRVRVRLKEIKQFLAIKEMHLAVQFDCTEHSLSSLKNLGLEEGGNNNLDGLLCWGLCFGEFGGIGNSQSCSRLIGKRLIPPLPKEKSGFWGFATEEPKKYIEFITAVDDNGDEILVTSDEDKLDKPNQPDYRTPVYFRKDVLDKYYHQTSKYSIEDGYLRCGGLWGIPIDNHQEDVVVAWLGDLGRYLPYYEQFHWRSCNIPPKGAISETFHSRQNLANFSDSDNPEHIFKRKYQKLQDKCIEMLGWPLLLPLAPGDEHYFKSLRIPSLDEQKDFDEVVLALTKILIDSLNEKKLNTLITKKESKEITGSISCIENVLASREVAGFEPHIKFLRDLQSLRSSGTAHRKGTRYQEIAKQFQVDNFTLRAVFQGIISKALSLLDYFDTVVSSGTLEATAQAGPDGEIA